VATFPTSNRFSDFHNVCHRIEGITRFSMRAISFDIRALLYVTEYFFDQYFTLFDNVPRHPLATASYKNMIDK